MNLRYSFFLLPFLLGLPLLGASFAKDAWRQPSLKELRALQLTPGYEKFELRYLPTIQQNNSFACRTAPRLPRHIPVIIIPAPIAKMLFERLWHNLQRQHSTPITAARLSQLPQHLLLLTWNPLANTSPQNEPDQKSLAELTKKYLPAPSMKTEQHVSPYAFICSQEHYNAEKQAWTHFQTLLQPFFPTDLIQLIASYAHEIPTLTPSKAQEETQQIWFKSINGSGGSFNTPVIHFFTLPLLPVKELVDACQRALPQSPTPDRRHLYLMPFSAPGKIVLSSQQDQRYLNVTKVTDLRFHQLFKDKHITQEPLILGPSEKELESKETSWSWKNLDSREIMSTLLRTYHDPQYPHIQWANMNQIHEALCKQGLTGTLLTMQPVLLETTAKDCPWALLKSLHITKHLMSQNVSINIRRATHITKMKANLISCCSTPTLNQQLPHLNKQLLLRAVGFSHQINGTHIRGDSSRSAVPVFL